MSADNGVYILKCKDQYRVNHLQAIDNISWSFQEPMGDRHDCVPTRIVEMFGKCKYTRNKETALKIAGYILEKLPVCEYGIQFIPVDKTWNEIENETKEYAKNEISNLESIENSKWDYDLMELKRIFT